MIDDWLIRANKDVGLLSFKLEWFNLTVMRFLQDVISNRRRQRDWTNPWPLICSGSRRPVIPAMVSPPISALFPVVSTERLRVVLEGKSHLCPFCWTGEHVKMQTAAATFILPLSSPSQHYLITDEPQHTHASRIWVGIPPRFQSWGLIMTLSGPLSLVN